MLSGPPGLGKTTLAHIIAKHAGYNVVEINARLVIAIVLNHKNGAHSIPPVVTSVLLLMFLQR